MKTLADHRRQKHLADKPIKTPSEESEKNKSSDSKVLYLIKPTDEAIEDLLDAIYGLEEKDEEHPTPGAK